MPGEMAPINISAVLAIVFWLLLPGLRERLNTLRVHPVFWAFQAYFWLLVIGLAWTDDIAHGLELIDHALPLVILAPALLTLIRHDNYEHVITAYLLGVLLCVVLAHYNLLRMHWFVDWPEGIWVNRSPGDTAPFVDRVTYAPMLAWAALLSLRRTWSATGAWRVAYGAMTLAIVNNLLFSGGRTGVLAFLVLLGFFIVWQLRMQLLRAIILSVSAICIIAALSYGLIPHFKERVDLAIAEVTDYENHLDGGVSERILMAGHAWHLFQQAPVFGLGTGDYKNAYEARHKLLTPQWRIYSHPHNQFLYTATITGIVGLVVLLLVYYPVSLLCMPFNDGRDDLRIALCAWMTVVSLFGSYLWRSQTAMFFVLFSCLAWAAIAPRRNKQTTE